MSVSAKLVLRVEDGGDVRRGERLPDIDVRFAPGEPALVGAQIDPTLVVAILGGTAVARAVPPAATEWAFTRRPPARVGPGDRELEVPRGLVEAPERAIRQLPGGSRP